MDVLNIGSLNIDYVYGVKHFVMPGETLSAKNRKVYPGGKGLNQSVAMARAGLCVSHLGVVGPEEKLLLKEMTQAGVDLAFLDKVKESTGHAIIQVNAKGENCILLFGGANQKMSLKKIEAAIKQTRASYVLLQNETNLVYEAISIAKKNKKIVVWNPAPMHEKPPSNVLRNVDILIVNEIELEQLTGIQGVEAGVSQLTKKHPRLQLVVTLGAQGVLYQQGATKYMVPAKEVKKVLDTTAAGDTFIGYFLSGLIKKKSVKASLQLGCQASAICVSKKGACSSIPTKNELIEKG